MEPQEVLTYFAEKVGFLLNQAHPQSLHSPHVPRLPVFVFDFEKLPRATLEGACGFVNIIEVRI